MDKIKNSKGITIIALVVITIILLIIAGIGTYEGIKGMEKVKLEQLKTNMLLIEAKAREYVEEANFKMGKETDSTKIAQIKSSIYENGENGALLQKASEANLTNVPGSIPVNECYVVTQESLQNWGLDNIKIENDEKYLIKFDEENLEVEIYSTTGYNGNYSLTSIEQL